MNSLLLTTILFLSRSPQVRAERRQPTVHISVSSNRKPIPCRLTIVDSKGRLAEVKVAKAPHIAVRTGVVYTANGVADVSLALGDYTVYATRGPMFSLAQKRIMVQAADQSVELTLNKEVNLPGYVSCDTHIHTLTFSGHGDCTGEERLVTLAAELIELPISTEHNRHVDYGPLARATGTSAYLTSVIGNEITTPIGHFNAFPMPADAKPPVFDLKDRNAVLAGIRAVPGVRFVTFNHTNDTHGTVRPAHPTRFHALSGESLDGQAWDVDGIEVINSSAQQSDPMSLFRIWFALLNSGKPVVAVGSSDSHDVNAYIVGQGRTYIASSATRPDRIDTDEALRNLKSGKALVSLGLVTELWVDGKFGVGDLATGSSKEMTLRVRVRGPQWMTADRLEIYANGGLLVSRPIIHSSTAVIKADFTMTVPRPKHDAWLSAIATGPGPSDAAAPYWQLSRPYQPTLADWKPRLIGATNPIRVDGDGDGRYSSPRDYAVRVIEAAGTDLKKLVAALDDYDPAVMIQAAAFLRQRGTDLTSGPMQKALDGASGAVVQAFKAYQIVLKREKE